MSDVLPGIDKQRLGVFKFASCDGCQLSLLNCEEDLLTLADKVHIAYFLEASSRIEAGPFDIALIEGSISTLDDAQRIRQIRQQSKKLVTIGACATSGGIQALRNWADHDEFVRHVYAEPAYIDSLAQSTAIADHVQVDFELRGCPIDRQQLLDVLGAMIAGRKPRTPVHSVCLECKRREVVCVAVAQGQPCLGPVTQAGCGAICPAYDRGCYGCFGPSFQPNCQPLTEQYMQSGTSGRKLVQLLRNVNAAAPLFQIESDRIEAKSSDTGADL